jgi:hypothetical protein
MVHREGIESRFFDTYMAETNTAVTEASVTMDMPGRGYQEHEHKPGQTEVET